tara:strand:- start:94 stop:348 length:255 start_codon:yes stop_codon:yes gene_type:complete
MKINERLPELDDYLKGLIILDNKNNMTTTSLLIADKFNKDHKDVLKAIRNLECSEEFAQRNFALSHYLDKNTQERPMYKITKDI